METPCARYSTANMIAVRFERADAVALPFGAGRFDAACISFALHEMPAGVRRRALAEIVRVTKPGAQVIIVDYGLPRSRLARGLVVRIVRTYEGRHYVEFLAEDLRGILEDAGIRVDREWSALGGVARVVTGHRTGSQLS
ncbi:methyltransferase domain-containing protein [Propioniciclava sinopodophylli]|uniref:methyltransferase domain-containing protein n=1 Tax=Propioniciclava sinopodophylli TaxID=1837344 RepID=UPI0024926AD8|nr:methyltransferase domain-containing protein [Propioniciclava sinopodophylli]